jgi:hypothetical protein
VKYSAVRPPLPGEVWLESRVRADLRWIRADYPTRYRFRIEATREFTVLNHTVVPYVNVEWFYDTRYEGWARTLYQLGPEGVPGSPAPPSRTLHGVRSASGPRGPNGPRRGPRRIRRVSR